jgi:hypothetical protein
LCGITIKASGKMLLSNKVRCITVTGICVSRMFRVTGAALVSSAPNTVRQGAWSYFNFKTLMSDVCHSVEHTGGVFYFLFFLLEVCGAYGRSFFILFFIP